MDTNNSNEANTEEQQDEQGRDTILQDRKKVAWKSSPEYKSASKMRWMISLPSTLIMLGSVVYLAAPLTNQKEFTFSSIDIILPTILLVLSFFVYVLSIMTSTEKRSDFERKYRLSLLDELDNNNNLANNSVDGSLELEALWLRTEARLNIYHQIATDQAAASFKTGKRFAVGGFFVIVVAGIGALLAPNTTATIAAAAIATVAAAMTSYIGATFMKSQSESSAQLREFFNQPVEFARVLSAERLVETLDKADRPAVVQNVIQSIISGASPKEKPNE